MGIKDRDYWQDASGDYEPEHTDQRPAWTRRRILAWVAGGLAIAAFIALAILGHSR